MSEKKKDDKKRKDEGAGSKEAGHDSWTHNKVNAIYL